MVQFLRIEEVTSKTLKESCSFRDFDNVSFLNNKEQTIFAKSK